MGLLDSIFRPQKAAEQEKALREAKTTFTTLTAYKPRFSSWDGMIYESDLVRAAIDARARHISKLKVEVFGAAKPSLQSKLRQGPNEWQTWSQFLYRLSTILDVHTTAVIVPVKDEYLITTGYFPVLPTRCEVVDFNGEPWLRYKFAHGQAAATPMRECAVMTKYQLKSDFFGDGNHALDETMKLVHINNEGIEEAVKNSAHIRFIGQVNNFTMGEDLKKEQARFSRENFMNNDSPLLLFPNTYSNIKQVDSQPYTVDAPQMELIKTNVSNYFAVNEKVMQSAANGDELDAFFNSAIEPFAIQFSEAMTKAMFTERERAQGSYLIANANRLQYMSTAAKVQMAKELGDRGALMIDEIRELFNYAPLPDGAGQVAPIRGEYKATDDLAADEEEGGSDAE
jgi:hypothetical protein